MFLREAVQTSGDHIVDATLWREKLLKESSYSGYYTGTYNVI
jgi:hypothetical protein